jgi:cytochrome c553
MARSTGSPTARDPAENDGVMRLVLRPWCAVIVGLATSVCGATAHTQGVPLDERIRLCGTCHGEDGNSRTPDVPSLAGQPAFFVMNQLFLMREGVRQVEAMAALAKELRDDELDALAKHFAKLPPKASDEPIDPALARRGTELSQRLRCSSCHLPSMAGQDQMPRLAKQRLDYLITAMKALRDNKRAGADTQMSSILAGLSDTDLAALAHYTASR